MLIRFKGKQVFYLFYCEHFNELTSRENDMTLLKSGTPRSRFVNYFISIKCLFLGGFFSINAICRVIIFTRNLEEKAEFPSYCIRLRDKRKPCFTAMKAINASCRNGDDIQESVENADFLSSRMKKIYIFMQRGLTLIDYDEINPGKSD